MPGSEDCHDKGKCLKILYLILDNEATAEEQAFMEEHLDCCMPCLQRFELEKEIKELLKKKLAHKEVPQDLVTTIRDKISYSL